MDITYLVLFNFELMITFDEEGKTMINLLN